MTQIAAKRPPRRGRIFPDRTLPPEELASRKAERLAIGDRCRQIFERLRPQLLGEYYNYSIAIEPESGEYLIDPKLEGLIQKIRDRYGSTDLKLTIFRLDETGACGKI